MKPWLNILNVFLSTLRSDMPGHTATQPALRPPQKRYRRLIQTAGSILTGNRSIGCNCIWQSP